MDHNNTLGKHEDTQLIQIIGRCYAQFCSNNMFGIASYLGRRIRHGTFKGHLYSGVISIESQYSGLLQDPGLAAKWNNWKAQYESIIDNIIRDRLHVASSTKRQGLLKPHIKDPIKMSVATSCNYDLAKEFLKSRSALGAPQIIAEYCWRLAEVDLKNVNSFLKGKKSSLIDNETLADFRQGVSFYHKGMVRDFTRDLQRLVDEKLIAMYGWFKRPISVAPKASLSLLYKAVVAEVRETFSCFEADTSFDEDKDIELVGGAYHVLYDAFYVVVYNAAKHGAAAGQLERVFSLVHDETGRCKGITVTIKSKIDENEDEAYVAGRLKVSPDDDIENAQLSEDRSGIKKLYHLQATDNNFKIRQIECREGKVVVGVSYDLVH